MMGTRPSSCKAHATLYIALSDLYCSTPAKSDISKPSPIGKIHDIIYGLFAKASLYLNTREQRKVGIYMCLFAFSFSYDTANQRNGGKNGQVEGGYTW